MSSSRGFCAVMAVVGLIGTAQTAYGQAGTTGRAASTAATVENAVQGNTRAGTAANMPPAQVPVSGELNTTSPGSLVTSPNNLEQEANQRALNNPATGVTGAATTNQPAGATIYPSTATPAAVNNPAALTNRTYSSYYVPGTQGTTPGAGAIGVPGMGYNTVNPMGTTMAPGTYYSGAGYTPYGVPTTTYSSMYVTPGFTTPIQTYSTVPRRGLFGGMFRRNRQVYTTAPYTYTYGTAPSTYTYSYGTVPGTYTYTQAPY